MTKVKSCRRGSLTLVAAIKVKVSLRGVVLSPGGRGGGVGRHRKEVGGGNLISDLQPESYELSDLSPHANRDLFPFGHLDNCIRA